VDDWRRRSVEIGTILGAAIGATIGLIVGGGAGSALHSASVPQAVSCSRQ
jgi:outer membrane lipoprotein SlyB